MMTRSRSLCLLGMVALAVGNAACSKDKKVTEIILEINSNLQIPTEMNAFYLSVWSNARNQPFERTYKLGKGEGLFMLPAQLTLVPSGTDMTVNVKIIGLHTDDQVISREVSTSFVKGESKLLHIDLLRSCLRRVCPTNQTCISADTCTDVIIDPNALSTFKPSELGKPSVEPDSGLTSDGGIDGDNPSEAGRPDLNVDRVVDVTVADGSAVDTTRLDVPATKQNGTLCTTTAECQSGFCTDGVCCASECKEVCHSCNLAGQAGHCAPAWPGTDPRENCSEDDERTCKKTGACDGKGACQLYPAGIECFPQACSGFARATASRCDGEGICARGPVLSCAPTLCDDQSPAGECLQICSGNNQCLSPAICQGGSCGKKALAAACTQPSDCNSGFCADGVCCQNVCTERCHSCAVPGSLGACIAVPSGNKDPKNQCKVDSSLPCGNDATCDGSGHCKVAPAGTPCADAICNGPIAVAPKFCDGLGSCLASFQQSCEPFACSSATCKSSCTSSSDCAPGAYCLLGECIGKKGAGAVCQLAVDCKSGFCTDGVCCDSACTSFCSSCNQRGREGTCSPVASGSQPKNGGGCPKEEPMTCGKDGTCDGLGKCRYYGEDTICKSSSCSNATKILASTCNGSGICVAHGSQTCAPFECGGTDCLATCAGDSDCVSPAKCEEGSCGKKPLGGTCQTGTDCQTGICAQGFCCNVDCSGTCQSCAIPGYEGTCKPVPSGMLDPEATCIKAATPDTCGLDGMCNGAGACRFYQGNTCGTASCVGSSLLQAGACDGQGQCQFPPAQLCSPFLCKAGLPACKDACISDTDCIASAYCNQGMCTPKKINGTACTLVNECLSNYCVDGFCCGDPCTGPCTSCKITGSVGTCVPVALGSASEGDCPDEGVATCGRNGKCDGAGSCMRYASDTICVAESCPAGMSTHIRSALCDGTGHCVQGQVQECAPYMCNGATNSCFDRCTPGGSECMPPIQCTSGSCGTKPNGQTCSSPGECASNFCEQGVCCSGSCQSSCKSCAVEGSLGTCSFVKAGQSDPQNQCQDQGVPSCGTNGWCDGNGGCQKYPAGLQCQTICDPASATYSIYTCDGNGDCGLTTPKPCVPYTCDNTGCRQSCTNTSECAPGYICSLNGKCLLPPEDCMNGIDDDKNGLVDCADPACTAGFMCVPKVPSGFTGPAELYHGIAAEVPSCGGTYPINLFSGFGPPKCDFSCSPCGCGSPTDVKCGNPGFSYTTIQGLECPPPTAVESNKCTAVPLDSAIAQFQTASPTPSGGSCPTTGGMPILSDIIWSLGLLCTASGSGGGGCSSGNICWPRPQPSFLSTACVFASGSVSCPGTGYTTKRNFYDSQEVDDTRACSGLCGCDAPTGGTCKAEIAFWSGLSSRIPDCSDTPLGTYSVPSACRKAPSGSGVYMFKVGGYADGDCKAHGTVTPRGGCTPMGTAVTTCCTP
jgi:hypothetical protein